MRGGFLWAVTLGVVALLALGGVERFYTKNFLLSLGILMAAAFLLASVAIFRKSGSAKEPAPGEENEKPMKRRGT